MLKKLVMDDFYVYTYNIMPEKFCVYRRGIWFWFM